MNVFAQKWLCFGQKWMYPRKVVVIVQKLLHSDKLVEVGLGGCIRAKVVVFWQNGCILEKVVVIG